jgi:hypothetical protein
MRSGPCARTPARLDLKDFLDISETEEAARAALAAIE